MSKLSVSRFRARLAPLCLLAGLFLFQSAQAAWQDGLYQDTGPGYHGDLLVTTTIRSGQISDIQAQNRGDTPDDFLQTALDGLKPALIQNNGAEGVDVVAGATRSSQGILEGVKGALEQASVPALSPASPSGSPGPSAPGGAASPAPTQQEASAPAQLYAGLAGVPNFRAGPGEDANKVPVYSFNVTMASCLFDAQGKILDVQVDIYEVATPNYDGASMPHFSGWPARQGYNITDPATGQVTGVSVNTEQNIGEEINGWVTKRERGAAYGMNPANEWYQQMDAFQHWMVGKTTQELRAWFAKFTSPRNGRPIKASSDQQEDLDLLASMTEAEKAELADVVSRATMSLSDAHGHILEAIEKAYENRKPVQGVSVP
ncbi:MAG: FMN-binding protein [Candidatus Limiplasma sp.]|nr:FMN-binding protein [Candidatus Limiplasma sp.]